MHQLILSHKQSLDNIIENLKSEMGMMRTGRINPAMIEHVSVKAYDTNMSLRELASITIADQRTLAIEPWDKSVLGDIEKALLATNLGFGVVSDGKIVRASISQMTTENRKEIVKVLYKKIEETKITLRQARDKIKTLITTAEQNKEITEDIKYSIQKQLDEEINRYNETVKTLGEEKEKEIMTI